MNERIRELAEQQAGSILMDLVMPDAGMPERVEWNVGCTTEHLEQFAELIVQECVRYFNEDYQRDFDTLWREDLSKGIKNHFGVEE